MTWTILDGFIIYYSLRNELDIIMYYYDIIMILLWYYYDTKVGLFLLSSHLSRRFMKLSHSFNLDCTSKKSPQLSRGGIRGALQSQPSTVRLAISSSWPLKPRSAAGYWGIGWEWVTNGPQSWCIVWTIQFWVMITNKRTYYQIIRSCHDLHHYHYHYH